MASHSVPTALAGGLACAAGCLIGIPLTPDLDQEAISTVEYKIVKYTLGAGFLWTAVWFPYALSCKHRGVSHWPFVGTLGRLVYLGVVVALAIYLLKMHIPHVNIAMAAWALVGLLISDIAHWALDVKFGDPFDHPKPRGYSGHRSYQHSRRV